MPDPRVPASSEPRPDPSRVDKAASDPTLAAESWVSEPRPENPVDEWLDRYAAMGGGPLAEATRVILDIRAAFDAVVAERDEMIRVSAANIAATQRNMDALRAHTLGAHDRPLCCGCDDDIETLAAMANAGDRLAKVVARVCGEGHPALAAWRSVSGSSEPR